ncbi:MAG: hypothetical protein SH818_14170 [Saprospiraceae bacterium]|nr:hypothetical protein [Saprospiraceae bacterium]
MNHFLHSIRHYNAPDLDTTWDNAGEIILIHNKLAPDEILFTDKMIQAFDWPGMRSCHQVYNPDLKINYQLLWAQKQIRLVISFGIPPMEMGLNILLKPYQLTYFEPFYIYLTDPVARVAGNKENKGMIWKDLRTLTLTP